MVATHIYILLAKLRTHYLSMSICYISCTLILELPLALHKFFLMLNDISIRELDCTLWNIFFSHICVSISWEYDFMSSSPYGTFCIELHCDLKLCFESSIKCFRLAFILHIELRNHLIGLNPPYTHTLLVWLLYAKWYISELFWLHS